ncbi:MAG: response regulator transcription factor [Actinobacteria bacterium]|nr:response regulator transcription factor [Actinomycetota bacterium]
MLRVLIVDDHELVRRGLRDLLESDESIEVVAEQGNVFDGFNAVKEYKPDLVILDVRLPDGNGIELCREIQSQITGVKVIMLTAYADDEALLGAILAGASGYLLKDIKGEMFLRSIHKVAAGENIFDQNAAERVRERLRAAGSPAAEIADLSDQERRILTLIGDGLTNKQIAESMFIAEKTVKNYVSSLLAKLGLERRTQAASLVTRVGMRPDSQRNLPNGLQTRF